MATALNADEIERQLEELQGWTHEDDRLVKGYEFSNFREAVSFIVRIGFEAEEMNHHPELTNVYNQVDIALTTHDADDRVTERDLRLAQKIDAIAWV